MKVPFRCLSFDSLTFAPYSLELGSCSLSVLFQDEEGSRSCESLLDHAANCCFLCCRRDIQIASAERGFSKRSVALAECHNSSADRLHHSTKREQLTPSILNAKMIALPESSTIHFSATHNSNSLPRLPFSTRQSSCEVPCAPRIVRRCGEIFLVRAPCGVSPYSKINQGFEKRIYIN